MAQLLLRGEPLGTVEGQPLALQAVLFDKDGTLSHSEPMLLRLALARIDHCLALLDRRSGFSPIGTPGAVNVSPSPLPATAPGCGLVGAGDTPSEASVPQQREGRAALINLLRRAYGIDGQGVHPGGITAVAARDHNLIATATAVCQAGLIWPDALAVAEAAFEATDSLAGGESLPEPTAGLIPLLDRFARAGLVCAVISNDHRQGIHSFLARHGLAHRFAATWSADDHPRKPSAGAVRGLCDLLGIPPGRCALIGDAASDLRMAAAAGVPLGLGYRSGWQRPPGLDPDSLCLEHWDELDAAAL
jgi:phosphoglycolate phosphatase